MNGGQLTIGGSHYYPTWYKGGCIECGTQDGGWKYINCKKFIWFKDGKLFDTIDKHIDSKYLVIRSRYYGFPFCNPCYFRPELGDGADRDSALILRAMNIIDGHISTPEPDTTVYDNCLKCGFEYPYGGPAMCKQCDLWKTISK